MNRISHTDCVITKKKLTGGAAIISLLINLSFINGYHKWLFLKSGSHFAILIETFIQTFQDLNLFSIYTDLKAENVSLI